MKTIKLLSLLFVVTCSSPSWASDLENISCAVYSPNVYSRADTLFSDIATSTFASAGQVMPGPLDEGIIFNDVFGNRALMGCQPDSTIDLNNVGPAVNTYNGFGMLTQQVFIIPGDDSATLTYTYRDGHPYQIQNVEQFCHYQNHEARYDISFTYEGSQLVGWTRTADAGCNSQNVIDIAYEYSDSRVPNLPTLMITSSNQDGLLATKTTTLSYVLTGDNIESVRMDIAQSEDFVSLGFPLSKRGKQTFNPLFHYLAGVFKLATWNSLMEYFWSPETAATDRIYWNFIYDNDMVVGMLVTSSYGDQPYAVQYHNMDQLKGIVDPRLGWGMIVDFDEDDLVKSTVQNTGFPQASPARFFYE